MTFLFILDVAAKSLAVLLLAFAVQSVWRNPSASQRCVVWLVAFASLLALPLCGLVEPRWTLAHQAEEAAVWHVPAETTALPIRFPAPPAKSALQSQTQPFGGNLYLSHLRTAVAVWLAGVALVLAYRLLGSWRLRQLRVRSAPCVDARITRQAAELAEALGVARPVDVRVSTSTPVPLTWGVAEPVLLMPADASFWDDETLSAALLHELAHIRNRDAATRFLATLVSALHWPNPLAWLAARAWRGEQERAADDVVLRAGTPAPQYALQLLEAARSFQRAGPTFGPALAMARPATLERRLSAIMDGRRNRRPSGKGFGWVLSTSALLLLGGLTSIRLQGEPVKPLQESANAAGDESALLPSILIASKLIKAPKGSLPPSVSPGESAKTHILSDADAKALVTKLQATSGADVLTTPRVATRVGQKATVEIGSELSVPGRQPPILMGPALSFIPLLQDGRISLAVDLRYNEKIGENKEAPVISSRTLASSATFATGQTAVFVFPSDPAMPSDLVCLVNAEVAVVPAAQEHAAGILLPRVKFIRATLADALDYLRMKSRPAENGGEGVNIVLSAAAPPTLVTLDMQNVTVDQVLSRISQSTGLALRYEGNAAIFDPPTASAAGSSALMADSPALARAREVILPVVQFKGATLVEAVEFIRVKSRLHTPDKSGIEIDIRDREAAQAPKIDLELQGASALQALQLSASQAGFSLVVEQGVLTLLPLAK